jgi:Concanavalin A-like lectin/glucanases superfamily
VTDELVKLLPFGVELPEQFDVVYPGNDAWLQLEQGTSDPGSDPAWLQLEKYATIPGGTPKVMTANGNAKIGTAQSKFGGSAALFDGAGDYISTPDHSDWALGSGDFCAEAFLRFGDLTFDGALMGQWDAAGNQMSWLVTWNGSNQLGLASSVNGSTNVAYNWNWSPSNGVWYHVAFSRNGTSIKMFVDGTELPTGQVLSTALFNSSAPLVIGGRADLSTVSLSAYMDEIRLSKHARYTAGFTPPSAPFTTDANTLLLLHCDGTNGSTTFVDDSPLPPTGIDPGSDPAWVELEH